MTAPDPTTLRDNSDTRIQRWPFVPPEWIVHEDDAVVVVDKPVGVPCQSADEANPDDLAYRLRAHYRACGEADYIGVHQRLDKHTSGLLVYTRSRRANGPLARQFEAREVGKHYLAVVSRFEEPERTLRHFLGPLRGERVRVASAPFRGAKEAVSHVRVEQRTGSRTVLSVHIQTGRTHQIRAQLASVGSPVDGDAAYGGRPAPRLMLHARRLELTHPARNTKLTFRAKTPGLVRSWIDGRDPSLREAIAAALESRFGLAQEPTTLTAFRLVHGAADGVPGLFIDAYGDYAAIHTRNETIDIREVANVIRAAGYAGVYVKKHLRRTNGAVAPQTDPEGPIVGVPAPSRHIIRENGVSFLVDLTKGRSTGLFLDQRNTRRFVREHAAGCRVLNLFGYTGAFSVVAALGQATEVTTVDSSTSALRWARENFAVAGISEGTHRFIREDAFVILKRYVRNHERFDLVIADPPTYSKTKTTRWNSRSGWVKLAELCMRVTGEEGRLVLSSNDERMRPRQFRRYVHEASRAARRSIAVMKDLPLPRDFPHAPEGQHLKVLTLGLDGGRVTEPVRSR